MNNGQIYTGFTKNLKVRMLDHQRGYVARTSKYLPISLFGYESYALKSDVQMRERYLKTTEGKRSFRQQYRDVLDKVRVHSSAG
jgi:putative endonuclease